MDLNGAEYLGYISAHGKLVNHLRMLMTGRYHVISQVSGLKELMNPHSIHLPIRGSPPRGGVDVSKLFLANGCDSLLATCQVPKQR